MAKKIVLFDKLFPNYTAGIFLSSSDTTLNVVGYLLKHHKYDNIVYCTFQEIAQYIGTSRYTVSRIIHDLIETDFIRPIGKSGYMINPDCIMRGNDSHYQSLRRTFNGVYQHPAKGKKSTNNTETENPKPENSDAV